MFNQKETAKGCLSEAAAAKNRSPGKGSRGSRQARFLSAPVSVYI